MIIAVAYENGQVFQHFGRTEQFKVYEVEDGKVISSRVVGSDGFSHGGLVNVLIANNADVFICGGIGGGARNMVQSYGIKLLPGVTGDADKAVESFLCGKLDYDPNTECHHHDGGEHTCRCH